MKPKQQVRAKQISRLGETPAEARARMKQSGGAAEPTLGGQQVAQLTPSHLAAIAEQEEGFSGGASDGPVEDYEEQTEPPTPTKAMALIRQLSQDKAQLQAELDVAYSLINRYKAEYGELD